MISIFINSFTSGGAEKVVLTLLQKFEQKNLDLDLVIIEKEQFYELPKQVSSTYLTQFDSLEKGLLKIPYLFICAPKLKKHVEANNIKIVQSHLPRAIFINAFAKMIGSKHHAQAIIHARINFEDKPWVLRKFIKWVYRKVLYQMDTVISICDVMKNEVNEYLDLKNHPNHLRIYNPHNLEKIRKMSNEIPIDFIFSPDKKYIICVGRWVGLKKFGDVIQALSQLENDNVELIFIGNGEEEMALKKITKALDLEKAVHFLGYRDNPYQYLSRADIYVLSSETEGLPNIIIESMVCGTPVISSDCISGPREILYPTSDLNISLKNKIEKGTYGILYPVGEVELLKEAINLLLENKDLCNEFIRKGYERIEEFDDFKITQKYIETFSVALEKS